MDLPFRAPSEAERRLVSALLEAEFQGRTALVRQLADAKVRTLDQDGSFELLVEGAGPAEVTRRTPVEAEVDDLDGTTVRVLLHVADGFLAELEIFREDSQPLQREINPRGLRTVVF
jgi:hypothetical protein